MWRLLALGLLLIVVGAGALAFAYSQLHRTFSAPGSLTAEKIIEIPKGSGVKTIAQRLVDAGVIEDSWVFLAMARIKGADAQMKAGEYALPARASMREVMDLLREGKTLVHRLTIPEGLSSSEVLALVRDAPALTGEVPETVEEGRILPETYHYQRGDDRSVLIGRMTADLDRLLEKLWQERKEGLPLASPEEALILASIVEKETGVGGERPLVAGVFINRLKKGMRLQSDPTVIYGITLGKAPLGRPLSRADLKKDTPYNTYTIDRLPPGPIANAGREALAAVLQPADTKYLYFVADGTGGHAFAKTLAEHNKNVAKWRKIEKARKKSSP